MCRVNCACSSWERVGWLALAPAAQAQVRPYIGFVYPAGGQQGTTFQIKLGGQGLEDVNRVFVTGSGVTARVVEYDRTLNTQEITLLNEQLKELKRGKPEAASTMMNSGTPMMTSESDDDLGARRRRPRRDGQ